MTSKISIPVFDMTSLLPDATILIIGKRRSGKSVLLKDIFYHHQAIPQAVVISGTESASPFFRDFIPDTFIYNKYNSEKIKKVINRQKLIINEARDKGLGNNGDGKTKENNVAIVFDDLQADVSEWVNDQNIKDIFFNGRHYNIFFVLSLQYMMGLKANLRSNIDYVFVFSESSFKNKRKIWEDYFSFFPDFGHFCNVLDQCTTDYGCLIVKTCGESSPSWYKASLHGSFKVGKDTMWKYHKNNYNKSHLMENALSQKELLELQQKYKNAKNLKVVVSKQGHVKTIDKVK